MPCQQGELQASTGGFSRKRSVCAQGMLEGRRSWCGGRVVLVEGAQAEIRA